MEDQRYISDEAIEWVVQKLDLQPIDVLECVTFYPMFRRKPPGKKHVKVCRTLSCALRRSYAVCKTLREELRFELGKTSDDGNFTVEFVECIASCGTAPVVQVNKVLHENVTPDKAKDFAAEIRGEKENFNA